MLTCYRYVGGHHGLGSRLVEEEAVGGRDHVLGGHQRAAAQVAAGADQNHPGVLVPLESYLFCILYLYFAQETCFYYYILLYFGIRCLNLQG